MTRRLIRTRDLSEFRRTLGRLASDSRADQWPGRRAFILPTHASIEIFRQYLEREADRAGHAALFLPDLLTRDEWLDRLRTALPGAPPMLTPFEREVMMARAARAAAARPRMAGGPFEIRPGLVSAMLELYDELRRRQRTIRRFVGVLFDELGVERGTDRGSESLIHQTCLLAFAFLGYERARAASGALDEHELRRHIAEAGAVPFDHLVVAVADHPSDPRGLWPADFELLGRLGPVLDLDVVVTDETHDAGFRERVEQELPGIEEIRSDALFPPDTPRERMPVLIRPRVERPDPMAESTSADRRAPIAAPLCAVHRDREDELRQVARAIRADCAHTGHELREPTAVVFQRPLPYIYLAPRVFNAAGVPSYALEALPLAGEPFAAALDLVLDVVRTHGARPSMIALLRSALLAFDVDGEPVALEDAAALDQVLAERRPVGGPATHPDEVEAYFAGRPSKHGIARDRAARAARAGAAAAAALDAVTTASSAAEQLSGLSRFLRTHERVVAAAEPWAGRHRRGRAAVLGVLDGLARACARHGDAPLGLDELTPAIHHWIERQTFAPRRAERSGVRVIDAVAARFGEFDHLHIVGLVENEWPVRMRRSIFYTTGLLRSLGWPQERDQVRAQQAAFRDLLRSPTRTVRLHGFMLEGDAIVAASPFVELARDMPARETAAAPPSLVFPDEVLTSERPDAGATTEIAEWLQARTARPPITAPAYAGFVGPRPPQPYRVSRVDRYVDCPFKYFAESVLGLPEEREEQSGLTPLERGALVHTLFERFYRAWHQEGHGTITPGTLPVALEMFGRLAQEALATLPAADRVLEEVRLLGSIVARGVAERIFELEADAGGDIVDRLLEFVVRGPVAFPRAYGLDQRTIDISGKADRIDVFRNGELRVIDYKLSRLPDTDTSIQIAAYAHAVQQMLSASGGAPPMVTQAMYLAFGDERQTEGRLAPRGAETVAAVQARAAAFADVVERIERGEYPPQPLRPGDCSWCRYAGVCRKEYYAEGAEGAESAERTRGGAQG